MVVKAVALFSGGLDSILAVKLIQLQGVEVIALHLVLPFQRVSKEKDDLIKQTASDLGVQLKIVKAGKEYFDILKNPKYGYGKNLNPCIDCRIFMLKEAKKMMKREKASFLISGEVLGQRPMSQNKRNFERICRAAKVEGILLRPLSAKSLAPSVPEEKGWVKREQMLDIRGRPRNSQILLARKLGIKKYPWPAGGCLLTEKSFCLKVKDLIEYKECNLDNAQLLKIGRHFRLTPSFKLVVGRNETENCQLKEMVKNKDVYFEPDEVAGPSALGRGKWKKELLPLCARIIVKYVSKGGSEIKIKVKLAFQKGHSLLSVTK